MLNDNLGDQADAFYSLLMSAHEGLDDNQSHALNARLVLLFANEIGSLPTLESLIELAQDVAKYDAAEDNSEHHTGPVSS